MTESVRREETPFRYTEVTLPALPGPFGPETKIASVGSCFSEEISRLLADAGLRCSWNPNGIVYNPYSICASLEHLNLAYTADDFFEYGGLWHSWSHHGAYSCASLDEAVEKAESARKNFRRAVRQAGLFLLTVSSAVAYRHLATKEIVANCHKVPGSEFERVLLGLETCRASLLTACRRIRMENPDCPVVLTVSPVRHYPGELILNSRSKARLIEACFSVCEKLDNVFYFPAFEIVNDELRDYRFFADDLVHISERARDHVLSRFLRACFTPEVLARRVDAEKRARQSVHREMRED